MFLGQLLGLGHLLGNGEGFHLRQAGIVTGGPELIGGNVLLGEGAGVGQIPPGQERLALYGNTLVKVDDLIRDVEGRPG